MDAVGSEPIDKKQIIGVLISLSSHMFSKLRITPSAYCQSKTKESVIEVNFILSVSNGSVLSPGLIFCRRNSIAHSIKAAE